MGFRIFDASAFYAGIPFADSTPGFTTSKIFEEIKHIKKNHEVIQVLLDTERLVIKDPNPEQIKKIKKKSEESGDVNKLSEADFSVLALCMELDGELVTDDFALSNLAKLLEVKINPVMTHGIKQVKRWVLYCPGCNEGFTKGTTCKNCGTVLKRKLVKGKSLSVPLNK